jgi:hypothetical protein
MDAKRVILMTSVVFVLSVGVLSACCPVTPENPGVLEPTVTPQEGPKPTDAISPLESPLESPIEPPAPLDGQVLLQERCATCHDLVRVTGARKNRAEWEQAVDRMIGKGAQLNEEERDVLIDYLTETYGE